MATASYAQKICRRVAVYLHICRVLIYVRHSNGIRSRPLSNGKCPAVSAYVSQMGRTRAVSRALEQLAASKSGGFNLSNARMAGRMVAGLWPGQDRKSTRL